MDADSIAELWVYLSASPLLGLTITLVAYQIAHKLYLLSGSNPLLNPVAIAIALLITVLMATDTSYGTYFEGAQFVHFLLGPATVALAVPLYRQLSTVRSLWLPMSAALLSGLVVAALSAVGLAALLGAEHATLASLAPKSVTAPVAMGIAEKIGGLPSLTAALVVSTGIIGAISGKFIFDLLKIKDETARGIAMGLISHGIGTARAFQVSAKMGAFAGLAMALSAFLTAFILPSLLDLIGL